MTYSDRDALIVEAVRTPVGRHGGALRDLRPDDLAAIVIRAVVARGGIDPETIEDVLLGCANQAGEDNRNVARMAALLAGLPVTVPGQTINRLCGSGLQAVASAAQAIKSNEGDCFVAGGVESMTRAPFVLAKPASAFPRGDQTLVDTTLGWRFINPALSAIHPPLSLGETAERVADQHGVSRADQDAFALESQRRAAVAIREGRFKTQIVPVSTPVGRGESAVVDQDEHPRPETTAAQLAKLKPAFRDGGTVTAGNASGISDGAAALLVTSGTYARQVGARPLARVVCTAIVGVDPSVMGIGPVPATRKALLRAGIGVADLDVVELNEAFAAQAVACIRGLGLDPEKVNPNGGAIALGHPLGSTGARLLTALVHELDRRKGRYGLVTMCIGVGQGIAMVVERIASGD